MAKATITLNVRELIEDLRASPKALKTAKEFWVKRIQSFTWSGKSLVTGQPFAPLSPGYKRWRRKANDRTTNFWQQNRPGKFFKPNRSNLTLTGQLIESLKGMSNFREQTISVAPVGRRTDGQSNKDVAEEVAKNGRPFLGLDDKGAQRIAQIVKRDIRRNLAKKRRRR
jgi:hypothetical protein